MTNKTRYLVVAALVLIVWFFMAQGTFGATERRAGVDAGDCRTCHKDGKVLPATHPATKNIVYKDCLKCHDKAGQQKLEGKLPGSHIHGLYGVNCARCHGKTAKPSETEMKVCTGCHNTEKVVARTAGVKPTNPHTSPHYGPDLDCNLCHHQHSRSENYCAQCHTFDFKTP